MWSGSNKGTLKDPELAAAIAHAASKKRNLLPRVTQGSGRVVCRFTKTVRNGIVQTARSAKAVWNQKDDMRLTGPLDPESPNRTGLGALYVSSGLRSLSNEAMHHNIVHADAKLKGDYGHLYGAYTDFTIWVFRTQKALVLANFRPDDEDFRKYCEAIRSDNKVNSLLKQRGQANSDIAQEVTNRQDYTVSRGLARDALMNPEVEGIAIPGAHAYITTGDYNLALSPQNPTSPGSVVGCLRAIEIYEIVDYSAFAAGQKRVRHRLLDASEKPIAGFEQIETMHAPISLQEDKAVKGSSEKSAAKEGK